MNEPLLRVHDLSKQFVVARSALGIARGYVNAVDDISFDLAAGETLALVGESGCGKSTAGRLLLRLIEPTAGTVRFDGTDIHTLKPAAIRAFRAKAQLIFQDPYASLNPRMTIGDALAEPLQLHTNLSFADRRSRVTELLLTVGLKAEHAQRYPHEFSGGQRQRIAIARALAPNPKLIVCDEPVSALDVSIRAQVLNLLQDLQQKLGLAYVFISHDLGVVRHIANRIAVLYLGRIVEIGSNKDIFAEPRHPYSQALLSAIPVAQPGLTRERRLLPGDPPSPIDPPSGCHLNPRCPHVREICRTTRPLLDSTDDNHATACHVWREIVASGALTNKADPPSPELMRLFARFDAPQTEKSTSR